MSNPAELIARLEQGLNKLAPGPALTRQALALANYLKLLNQWNQAYNLTAVRDIDDMVPRHIFDSLALRPWLKGEFILDIGSGAGLPGLPLAITCPEKQFVLMDSNGKKTRFLQAVQQALKLDNVQVVQTRVENHKQAQAFDTITSRAFASLEDMIHLSRHLLAPNGLWLAMKGPNVQAELTHLSYPYQLKTYSVLDTAETHACVLIENLEM